MGIFDDTDRDAAAAVAGLLDANPFTTQRVELERTALGEDFSEYGATWQFGDDADFVNPNTAVLLGRTERLVTEARGRVVAGAGADKPELEVYRGAALYLLWLRYEDPLYALVVDDEEAAGPTPQVAFFESFARDVDDLLDPLPQELKGPSLEAPTLFAHGFQARRAFHHIFRKIFGGSLPAIELRAAAWSAIFSGASFLDRIDLAERIRNIPTLITGESGTGKDLVARAIGLSQLIPFDTDERRFTHRAVEQYVPVNLSALSPTVIESELFGHRRGAFTNAEHDHTGWLETAGADGAVFFDEIGDLDPTVQVKLLRVLQNRVFQRVGDTTPRPFASKIIAATHRDLPADVAQGRFRADFYRRICTNRIRTPSLRTQLAETPDDLEKLLHVAAQRVVGPDHAAHYAAQARTFVTEALGIDYAWPGNLREMEECVTSVFMQHEFVPSNLDEPGDTLRAAIDKGELSADELLRIYAQSVMNQCGSQREVARRLGLDRRAVKRLLDGEG